MKRTKSTETLDTICDDAHDYMHIQDHYMEKIYYETEETELANDSFLIYSLIKNISLHKKRRAKPLITKNKMSMLTRFSTKKIERIFSFLEKINLIDRQYGFVDLLPEVKETIRITQYMIEQYNGVPRLEEMCPACIVERTSK